MQEKEVKNVVNEEALQDAVRSINSWHQNTPLLLVFSKQKPGPKGNVSGNVSAMRNAYDALFNLGRIGVADDARKFYLHMCHGKEEEYPYCIRKPTSNYGKTHQRIIKDTFANPQGFLTRTDSGSYRLKDNFGQIVLDYLGLTEPVDLRPLVLYCYWNDLGDATTIGDLWVRFSEEFGTLDEPFAEIFSCTGLDIPIPTQNFEEAPFNIKQICLPQEFGTGQIDAEFWRRFRAYLAEELNSLKWQGDATSLVAGITSGLMHDQSVFLLGPPGTGKTTLVTEAILPALRKVIGSENELRFSEFIVTPETSQATLFGFQGLDGTWIMGPLSKEILVSYPGGDSAVSTEGVDSRSEAEEQFVDADELDVPRLLFFDEANRVDIEALLSPMQTAFDRMQQRKEPGVVVLGRNEYLLPRRIWRVFGGNSPAADTGRRSQSRPFKRRISVIIPPDVLEQVIGNSSSFQSMALGLLAKACESDDPEISESALSLFGAWSLNQERLEDLRRLLGAVRELPRVAVTVGLVETILLRASSHKALGRELPLDAALTQTLTGLISGDYDSVENLASVAQTYRFPQLAEAIRTKIIAGHTSDLTFDLDAIL